MSEDKGSDGAMRVDTDLIRHPGGGTNSTISLPVTFANSINLYHGNCRLTDATGTTNYQGTVFVTDTTMQARFMSVSGSNVLATAINATSPFTWATGDTIRMFVSGEIA